MDSALPVCRICLQISNEYFDFQSPFESVDIMDGDKSSANDMNYLECLRFCTNLLIENDKGQCICVACEAELQVVYKFLRKAHYSQTILEHSLKDDFGGETVEHTEITIEKCDTNEKVINDSKQLIDLSDLSYSCNDSLNDYLKEDNTLQLNKEDSGNEFDDIINYVEEYENNLEQTESLTDDTSIKNSPNTRHIFISQKYKCQICNRRYTTERLLKVHLNYHRRRNVGSKPYSCKICGEQFSLQRYLTQHMIDHQGCREIHKCQYCSKEYVTKTALISHKRVHQGETLNCTECGKQFNGTYEFRVHLRFHKREKEQGIYKCEICNKEYSLRRYLAQHMYAHHKERKTYKCDYCNKEYLNKTTLNNHKRLHEGQTTKCNECGKEFTRNCELKIHMRFHKAEHPFKCTMCDKEFTIKGHLKEHMWRHQGIKLECQECGKLFSSTKALKEHSYTHGEMPYPCEFCDKAYPSKQKYKIHLQKVHDSEGSENLLTNVEKSLNTQNIKRNKEFTYVQVAEEPESN